MAKPAVYLLLLFSVAALGCATTLPPEATRFEFELNGQTYQILGFQESDDEPAANILLQTDRGQTLLRAIDYGQTGRLDQLVFGTAGLDSANTVYLHGIALAQATNRITEREMAREFSTTIGNLRFLLESFRQDHEQFLNRLIIYTYEWDVVGIYIDVDADGQIDMAEASSLPPEEAAMWYQAILELAAEKQRLEPNPDQFVVIRSRLQQNPQHQNNQ
ncbi:MAG: hypothetical protein ACNA78_05190 [Balneolaceae bacterium]